MSAKKVQTLAGPSSKPSAKLADTTSASAGKKQRKAPTKASEMASNGGDNWTLAEDRQLWTSRWQQGTARSHKEIGDIIGRTAQACRLRLHKLLPVYRVKGYEGTFRRQRPAGLVEPPPEKAEGTKRKGAPLSDAANGNKRPRLSMAEEARIAAQKYAAADRAVRSAMISPGEIRRIQADYAAEDRAMEAEAALLAKEERAAAELKGEEMFRRGLERMVHASHHMREHAFRTAGFQPETVDETDDEAAVESPEPPVFEAARFRDANGCRPSRVAAAAVIETNKTTEYADPKKQARVEYQRERVGWYFQPVPTQEKLDDAGALLMGVANSDEARPSPDPQFVATRRTPQDPRQSVDYLMN